MKEVIPDIERRCRADLSVLAKVVGFEGLGSRDDNERAERGRRLAFWWLHRGAVVSEALTQGRGARRPSFGYSNDESFAVGLTCASHLSSDPR